MAKEYQETIDVTLNLEPVKNKLNEYYLKQLAIFEYTFENMTQNGDYKCHTHGTKLNHRPSFKRIYNRTTRYVAKKLRLLKIESKNCYKLHQEILNLKKLLKTNNIEEYFKETDYKETKNNILQMSKNEAKNLFDLVLTYVKQKPKDEAKLNEIISIIFPIFPSSVEKTTEKIPESEIIGEPENYEITTTLKKPIDVETPSPEEEKLGGRLSFKHKNRKMRRRKSYRRRR